MRKITKNEWIAVGAGIALVSFLLYGSSLPSFFGLNNSDNKESAMAELPQSGISTEDIVVGSGAVVTRGDTLTVHYVGALPSGKVFDSSIDTDSPFVFTIGTGSVIRGWEEGLLGMREGGRRRIIVAPDYGYGSQAVGPIPPDSTLIFEVQLLKVEKPN
jgi:FKBP-type peptidyl-prolyl cis-trans isomerase